MSAPLPICVLGMHRSGTSLVARLLNLLGVSLGPDRSMMPSRDDNPTGFWEHHPIVRINDELLARFGGHWDRPPSFPQGWERDPAIDDLRRLARDVVASDFDTSVLWGWKDPRSCLTLPFWLDIVGPVRCVMALRNPANVRASLAHRDGLADEAAAALWVTHVAASLRHSAALPRLFVFHDDLMTDVLGQMRRLAVFIGQPARADDPDVQQAALTFVDEGLWHHRAGAPDLGVDAAVPFAAKALYLALGAMVPRGATGDAQGDVAGASHQLAAAHLAAEAERVDALVRDAAGLRQRVQQQAAAEAVLTRALDDATARHGEVDAARLAADARAHEAEARLAAQVASTAALAHDLALAREARDQFRAAHARTVATLEEIQGSAAWTMVSAGRRQIARTMPASSARRRWLDAALARLRTTPSPSPAVCFCTMAIGAPYRQRARQLCADAPDMPWFVLTDEPEAFAGLSLKTIAHQPTGPMADDYRRSERPVGHRHGAAAYHDKRFVLQAALEHYDTAFFFDADSRLATLPPLPPCPPGLAVAPVVRRSIAEHLADSGTWRRPAFSDLARLLTGSDDILHVAQWCHETGYAVTRDGRQGRFFEVWDQAARWMQAREVFSGEGGVMGLAAAVTGWSVDHDRLALLTRFVAHEGGGPKVS